MMADRTTNATLIGMVEPSFGVVDYVVFAIFLTMSSSIGIFFSLRSQKTTGEYFFGNRQMSAVPVGISTGVSFLSAPSLVGYPAEIYNNGFGFMITAITGSISTFLGFIAISTIIHPLKINSLNEYYQLRFGSRIINFTANMIVLLCIFQYMGVCMFGAVIAFSSSTGGQVSLVLALIIGCSVGVFYTSIGGLKAVVWIDVLQCGFMFLGITAVLIRSLLDSPGDFWAIYETNKQYNRLQMPTLSTDLTIRHTMWGLTLGGAIGWISWTTQPAIIQRLCSLHRLRDCFIVSSITCCIYLVFSLLPSWAGLNIFAYYANKGCDVVAAGWVKKNDVLVYYIRDRLSYPGFQGLFIAALYAGSLSSLSSGLNSASAIIWNDLIRPCFRQPPSELRATLISKIIVVVFGVLAMLWSFALSTFGGLIIQVTSSIDASMYGTYFSLFVFAVLFRYATWKGAIAGAVISFGLTLWLALGSILHGKAQVTNLPTITDTCSITLNTTLQSINTTTCPSGEPTSGLAYFYSLSYLWFGVLCLLTFLIVSLLVTACTKSDDSPVDPNLLFRFSRVRTSHELGAEEEEDVENEKRMTTIL